MIRILEPIFQGELAPHGEALQCAPQWPTGALPVAWSLHQPSQLEDTLRRHARHLGVTGPDLRAVASAWSLEYLGVLLPPVVAAASLLQHHFPVGADQTAVTLDERGVPQCFHILGEGDAMPGLGAAARYDTLVWHHLDPLFAALGQHTRLPRKIAWGNAARHLEGVFDRALALTGQAPHVAADRDHLLHDPAWLQGRPNPLHAPRRQVIRIEDGQPRAASLHRQCCLLYRLPDQDYCGACPLSPAHRKHQARDLRAAAPRA